jgi:GNAT superfamily N-acetyltransferase
MVAAAIGSVMVVSMVPVAALVERSLRVGDRLGLDHWRSLGSATAGTGLRVTPLDAMATSLVSAAIATVAAVVIGLPAARAVAARPGGRSDRVLLLPLGVSATTIGLGLLLAFGRSLKRGLVVEEMMKKAHPEEPHWYLAVIGSDPTVRGKGFGQALMSSRLDRCDAEHAPAYLESSNPDNVPYYQRFGFEITGEITPPGGPTLIPMWRPAR